jgi:predicted deacylase
MSELSMITATVDFDRDGLQFGALRVPHSHNRSAYGHIPIPIAVARHGSGPTVVLTGANHGDEYEGPLGLLHLVRDLDLDRLNGRLIVVPALNYPAFLGGTRVSPIDQINLNRTFPGKRNGTVTEMIAHYVETALLPMADYAIDFHSGGGSLNYLPTLLAPRSDVPAERDKLDRIVAAFAAPRTLFIDGGKAMSGEDRVIGAAARRNGVFFLTGEFGGGASVNLDGLAVVRRGIAGVLDAIGVLTPKAPLAAMPPSRRLVVDGPGHYAFAPCNGLFEPAFRLGDEIAAGQVAGWIHDTVQPWKEPVAVTFGAAGVALCIRTYALAEAGDCLGHLGRDE